MNLCCIHFYLKPQMNRLKIPPKSFFSCLDHAKMFNGAIKGPGINKINTCRFFSDLQCYHNICNIK